MHPRACGAGLLVLLLLVLGAPQGTSSTESPSTCAGYLVAKACLDGNETQESGCDSATSYDACWTSHGSEQTVDAYGLLGQSKVAVQTWIFRSWGWVSTPDCWIDYDQISSSHASPSWTQHPVWPAYAAATADPARHRLHGWYSLAGACLDEPTGLGPGHFEVFARTGAMDAGAFSSAPGFWKQLEAQSVAQMVYVRHAQTGQPLSCEATFEINAEHQPQATTSSTAIPAHACSPLFPAGTHSPID